ncbi:MAG: YceI family protein [Actinobacteria bacterium]|nr:YceI family protein [Actinomycetota bacterium]
MTLAATSIPGYLAGTWTIDPAHSDISFSVRHMMVSKVKGRFGSFSGVIVTAADPLASTVTAEIDATSIDTNQEQRDAHIKSADFFEVEKYPTITFASTSVEPAGSDFLVRGDLTIKGNTRPVALKLELNGFGPDPYGGTRAGFTASTEISRKEFGVDIDLPMDGGGVVVGDKISIVLEIEAVLNAS